MDEAARLASMEARLQRIEEKVDTLLGSVGSHVTHSQLAGVLGTCALIVIGVVSLV